MLNKQLSIKHIIQSNTTRLQHFYRLFVYSKNKQPIKRPWNSTWILRSTFIWRKIGRVYTGIGLFSAHDDYHKFQPTYFCEVRGIRFCDQRN